MRKIKLALLAPYSPSSITNGLAEHINKLTKYLSYREDIELHIITIGDKNKKFKKDKINIHVIKKLLPNPFYIPSSVWSLKHRTIEINPHIVHAEGSFATYSTAAALLRNRYPTLLTVLGFVQEEIKFQKGTRFISYVLIHKPNERYVVSKIPNIIVQSPHITNLICNMTKSKIYVVPEGIEFEEIQDSQLRDLNENPDIFIVARLKKLKGIDILIKSIPALIKSIPELKVSIAGSGEEEEKLKGMVKDLRLENHVNFLGYISDEEAKMYYKACKIVTVPSRWDIEPFAPLTATALGKPAIVSDKCNSSIIENGKTGFVFKSEDFGELSSRMLQLLINSDLREKMGRAAMEKAKKYDWKIIVNKKIEIYKEVIANFYKQ